ncbi:hypothetical protein BYT27DRAFT_7189775 [Phlegmacium glaucopus]|nr:hypothetical protein BYT27DRAFT_7189775 [Phlegmacium glaucopus]
MSATTMHFGPEWMRTKHQPLLRPQPLPSPPPQANFSNSTYSALVSSTPSALFEKPDEAHPFRYSKDELLKIYQESAGKGGLGLEVERWEGVVREIGSEPVALREMTDTERKLFGGSLNSDVRRRPSQSTDYITPLNTSTLERPRLAHNPASTASSPLRDRFGVVLKRRDSAASSPDPTTLAISRNPSLSTLQNPTLSSRETASRPRVGYTPSFDGVLNNGESWVARRRASEASLKSGNAPGHDVIDGQQAPKAFGIQEEKEDDSGQKLEVNIADQSPYLSSPHLLSEDHQFVIATDAHDPFKLPQGSRLHRNESPSSTLYVHERVEVPPPPGCPDLLAVEWSYKDPTGQIQGPFRADLMQKWYNDGYFSTDLPMKRTHYDNHWTTVGELVKQSNGENIFFCPPINAVPPGLGRANGSPLQTYPQTEQPLNEPYQPAPMRSLRASTLESYLMAGSAPSDSPSSSLGGASQFGNSSPDPSIFGGRNKIYASSDANINGRLTGLGAQEYFTPFTEKRSISYDYPSDTNGTQLPSFGNFGPERDLNTNGYGSDSAYAAHDPWKIPFNLDIGFSDHKSLSASSSNLGPSANVEHRQDLADINNSNTATKAFSQGTVYASPDISYEQQSGLAHMQSDHASYESFGTSVHDHKDFISPPSIRDHDEAPQSATIPGFWGNVSDTSRRSGVRDVQLLTSASVVTLPIVTAQSSWPRIDEAPISIPQSSNNTLNNLDGLSDNAWKVEPLPSSLTTEIIGQQKKEEQSAEVGSAPIEPLSSSSYHQTPEQFILDTPMRTLSSKTLNKVVSLPSPVNQPSIVNQPSVIDQPTPVEPLPTPKPVWAKEEDVIKKKASGISVSLREIQEAEAKQLESRKTAERERERERSARVIAEAKEDIQPFTASWGLPTSQAGSRSNSLAIRETPAVPVLSATAAVWTTPSLKQPAIKKTMKEIQEEEEKHKKHISKEAIMTASAKRGYADSTTKLAAISPPPPPSNNSVWTTVGANGKVSSAQASSPSRPPIQPSTSFSVASLSASPRASDSSAQKVVNPGLKPRPTPSKQENIIYSPSHEFLKWLSDSLKGLNSSVNVEEIVSMLLSFPLDPDASTIEIISDTIYSNSTTLDGRRFASEFVSKRKADANARLKGSTISTQSSVKPVSIADVVKATPKATQAEWGFKVVNKKKKGSRTN